MHESKLSPKQSGDRDPAGGGYQPEQCTEKDGASQSLVMAWDFERVITSHGDVPETNKAALAEALRVAGFLAGNNA